MQFFRGPFSQMGNSLGTNFEHMQSRCMAGGAKNPSFLAIFCSSVCARLLVHVRCPLIYDLFRLLEVLGSDGANSICNSNFEFVRVLPSLLLRAPKIAIAKNRRDFSRKRPRRQPNRSEDFFSLKNRKENHAITNVCPSQGKIARQSEGEKGTYEARKISVIAIAEKSRHLVHSALKNRKWKIGPYFHFWCFCEISIHL